MHDLPTEPTIKKIRALCQELAIRQSLNDDARDELCNHLEEKLAGYLSGEVKISEEDALCLVRAHFGDADQIARAISLERPSAVFLTSHVNHARLYSALLLIIGVSTALTIPLGLVAWAQRQYGLARSSSSHVPTWLLPWFAALSGAYIALILVTLTARRLNPDAGRRLTKVLNYALLPAAPFGTLLGMYGLLKVDKQAKQVNA
jgi:hypothetical protein